MEARPKKPLLGAIVLLVATVIWGLSYVAQSDGMRYLGPLTYSVSVALTFGVSLLVGWMVARKNKKIDMVEALKNAE